MSRLTIQEAIKKVEEMQDDMDSGYRTALIHGAPKDPNYELEIEALGMVIAELQRYKDLEDAGRLIELPCAVGDEYWCTERDDGGEGPVIHKVHSEPFACLVKDLWGIKCFATKEEAERKMKELNNESE